MIRRYYQAVFGGIWAVVIGFLVIGGLIASLHEIPKPSNEPNPKPSNKPILASVMPLEQNETQTWSSIRTATPFPTHPLTINPSPMNNQKKITSPPSPVIIALSPTNVPTSLFCPPPGGWYTITVAEGDTLQNLARKYSLSTEELSKANCVIGNTLIPGTVLYVPSSPPPATKSCGAPAGWFFYTVQPGDTLSQLSLALGISIMELQTANCLGDSSLIRNGQQLYVPFKPKSNFPSPYPDSSAIIPTKPSENPTKIPTSPSIPTVTIIPFPLLSPSPFLPSTPLTPSPYPVFPSATPPVFPTPWPSGTVASSK